MTDLGTLGGKNSSAHAINARGQVVGAADVDPSTGDLFHAFLWERGVVTDVGILSDGQLAGASHINRRGQVVGTSETESGVIHGCFWENGVITDLGTLGGSAPPGLETFPTGMNDRRQVVGQSLTPSGNTHAFLWEDGVIIDLGTLPGGNVSGATAINIRGQVVGFSGTEAGVAHAFLWGNGVMTDLGSLRPFGSDAVDINRRGRVIGRTIFAQEDLGVCCSQHAFFWKRGVTRTSEGWEGSPLRHWIETITATSSGSAMAAPSFG